MIDAETGEIILLVIAVVGVTSLGGTLTWVQHKDCLSYTKATSAGITRST